MEYDCDKVDEMTLALIFLVIWDGNRAWKGFDWGTMNRLHEKGFISNPAKKSKSIVLSDKGIEMSEKLFKKYFGKSKNFI